MFLAGNAGRNPSEDARLSGKLIAYADLLNIEVDEL